MGRAEAEDEGNTADGGADAPVKIPITEELDLHTFAPRDVPSVVAEYVDACAERGLQLVRIIHGRGHGVQRAVVRRLLARCPDVVSFRDAPPESGGWGSTLVWLRARAETHGGGA